MEEVKVRSTSEKREEKLQGKLFYRTRNRYWQSRQAKRERRKLPCRGW